MKNKNVFWGIILVVVGALFILDNLELINFSFRAIFDLWPAFLILWGISMLPIKSNLKTIFSVVIVLIAVAIGLTKDYSQHWTSNLNRHFHMNKMGWHDRDDSDTAVVAYSYSFYEEFDSTTKTAILNMDIAAGKFRIEESTDYLINFEAENNVGQYSKDIMKNATSTEIYVRLEDGHFKSGSNKNTARIQLNKQPNWDMKLDVGAADLNCDLREFKIGKIEIDGGASSIKLKIGDKQAETHINIESGASAVKIYIPVDAACELESNTVLSDLDLKDFVKEGKVYRTPNFGTGKQKIYIVLDAAISALDVIRE